MKVESININLIELEKDIILAKDAVNSNTNRYDIIFQSETLTLLENKVVEILAELTKESFDIYVKRFQSYIQTKDKVDVIRMERELKRGLRPTPRYSFILFTQVSNTELIFKTTAIKPEPGELIIFATEDFENDNPANYNRIGIIGSITNQIANNTAQLLI